MVRRTRLAVRTQNIQRVKVLMHFRNHSVDQRDKTFAIFIGAFNNFIVDIGNVTHILQLITEKTQIARDNVKSDKRASVANVAEIVNGDTTHVHADFPGMNGFEFLFLARQCIKNF
ncbi:hypothetical protein NGUA15_01050 [Salmonella enterica]|nr:hypothetical protein NGUA15_01050 [Salmonella enterica]